MNRTMQKNDAEDTLDVMNSWSFAFMIGFGFFPILIMQSLWDTISGLYFNHAYEAIVMPYTMYLVWNLYKFSVGDNFNKAKVVLMSLAFILLFLPSAFLLASGQLDFYAVIFNQYDPNLSHLPFAGVLPYIALAALLTPYKDFLTRKAQ